jgi:hypothetical protein
LSVPSASAASGADETQPAASRPQGDQTITVVNKIPPTLLNVLRHQFRLMERWMKPIFEATHSQSAEIQELKEHLETSLSNYQDLMRRIGASRQSSDGDE